MISQLDFMKTVFFLRYKFLPCPVWWTIRFWSNSEFQNHWTEIQDFQFQISLKLLIITARFWLLRYSHWSHDQRTNFDLGVISWRCCDEVKGHGWTWWPWSSQEDAAGFNQVCCEWFHHVAVKIFLSKLLLRTDRFASLRFYFIILCILQNFVTGIMLQSYVRQVTLGKCNPFFSKQRDCRAGTPCLVRRNTAERWRCPKLQNLLFSTVFSYFRFRWKFKCFWSFRHLKTFIMCVNNR